MVGPVRAVDGVLDRSRDHGVRDGRGAQRSTMVVRGGSRDDGTPDRTGSGEHRIEVRTRTEGAGVGRSARGSSTQKAGGAQKEKVKHLRIKMTVWEWRWVKFCVTACFFLSVAEVIVKG